MKVWAFFCKTKTTFIGRAFIWATGQGPSHSALAYEDPFWACSMQTTAEARGLQNNPADEAGSISATYLPPPQYDLRASMQKNRASLGAPYWYLGIFGMAWVEFWWLIFKKMVANPFKPTGAFFCDMWVAKICHDAGVPLSRDWWSMDPGMLEDDLVKAGFVRVEWSEVVP